MAYTELDYQVLFGLLRARIERSNAIHGDWSDYDQGDIHKGVSGEFNEYRDAVVRGQIEGKHGQIDELFDVAVVAMKGAWRGMELGEVSADV